MNKTILLIGVLACISCKSEKKKDNKEESYVVPSSVKTEQDAELSESAKRGKEVYFDLCVTCHLPSGKGIPGNFPPLDGSNWLTEKRSESIKAVKYGLKGPIQVNGKDYNNIMAPLGLTDQEVADVMNYTMSSWSNSTEQSVTLEEVKSITK